MVLSFEHPLGVHVGKYIQYIHCWGSACIIVYIYIYNIYVHNIQPTSQQVPSSPPMSPPQKVKRNTPKPKGETADTSFPHRPTDTSVLQGAAKPGPGPGKGRAHMSCSGAGERIDGGKPRSHESDMPRLHFSSGLLDGGKPRSSCPIESEPSLRHRECPGPNGG